MVQINFTPKMHPEAYEAGRQEGLEQALTILESAASFVPSEGIRATPVYFQRLIEKIEKIRDNNLDNAD